MYLQLTYTHYPHYSAYNNRFIDILTELNSRVTFLSLIGIELNEKHFTMFFCIKTTIRQRWLKWTWKRSTEKKAMNNASSMCAVMVKEKPSKCFGLHEEDSIAHAYYFFLLFEKQQKQRCKKKVVNTFNRFLDSFFCALFFIYVLNFRAFYITTFIFENEFILMSKTWMVWFYEESIQRRSSYGQKIGEVEAWWCEWSMILHILKRKAIFAEKCIQWEIFVTFYWYLSWVYEDLSLKAGVWVRQQIRSS